MAGRFNGKDWGANGPKAVTNVMYDLCNVNHADKMTPEKCLGIKIFPPSAFYKIPWRKWKDIFDPFKSEEILFALKGSFVLHTWGRFSSKISNNSYNKSAFFTIAENNCPVSFSYLL